MSELTNREQGMTIAERQVRHDQLVGDVQAVIDQWRGDIVNAEHSDQVSDANILGVLISKWADWTPDTVLEVAAAAAEDSNMHETAAVIEEWRNGKG